MSADVFAHAAYGIGLYGQDNPAPAPKVLARLEKFREAADAVVDRLYAMYGDDRSPNASVSVFLARLRKAAKSRTVAIDPMHKALEKIRKDGGMPETAILEMAELESPYMTPELLSLVYEALHAADFQGLKTWLAGQDIYHGHWMYTHTDDDGGEGSATPAESWIFGFGLYAFPMKSFPRGLHTAGARWHTWVTAG